MRGDFLIPSDDHRFQIIHTDAAVYRRAQQENIAEVIMLDGFSTDGPAQELNTCNFYAACLNSLTAGGILASNLWDSPASLLSRLKSLQEYSAELVSARTFHLVGGHHVKHDTYLHRRSAAKKRDAEKLHRRHGDAEDSSSFTIFYLGCAEHA